MACIIEMATYRRFGMLGVLMILSCGCAGDTVPLQTFVDFAKGSNVVLHESVGPFYNFTGTDVQSQNIILNHTTQAQVGSIFNALNVSLSRQLLFWQFKSMSSSKTAGSCMARSLGSSAIIAWWRIG